MPGENTWSAPDASQSPEPPVGLSPAGVATARGDARWPVEPATEPTEAADIGATGPVGAGGVLDGGFDFMRTNFRLLMGLTAAIYLPLQIVDLVLLARSGVRAEVDGPQLASLGSLGSESFGSWVVLALRVVALSVLGLAAGALVSDALSGRRRPGREVLGTVARRCWVAAAVAVMAAPAKVAGGCLAFVGFFVADALLMCASVVAGAESAGPLRSVSRSWRLGWRAFSTAVAVSFGAFVISTILQLSLYLGPALLTASFVSSEAVLIAVQQVSLLALLVTQPLTASIAARAYVELRCRAEALDLTLRAKQLGLLG